MQALWLEARRRWCRACQPHGLAALHGREGGGRKCFVCARLKDVVREKSSVPWCLFCSLANTGRNHHTRVSENLPRWGRLRYVCTEAKPTICRTSSVLGLAHVHVAMEAGCHCRVRVTLGSGSPLPDTGACPLPVRARRLHCWILYSAQRWPLLLHTLGI